MKVKELISTLEAFDEDSIVFIAMERGNDIAGTSSEKFEISYIVDTNETNNMPGETHIVI